MLLSILLSAARMKQIGPCDGQQTNHVMLLNTFLFIRSKHNPFLSDFLLGRVTVKKGDKSSECKTQNFLHLPWCIANLCPEVVQKFKYSEIHKNENTHMKSPMILCG